MLLHMPLTETTPPLGSGSLTTTMWSPSYTVKKWCPKCLPCIKPPPDQDPKQYNNPSISGMQNKNKQKK